jgi:hypothetical protein
MILPTPLPWLVFCIFAQDENATASPSRAPSTFSIFFLFSFYKCITTFYLLAICENFSPDSTRRDGRCCKFLAEIVDNISLFIASFSTILKGVGIIW